MTRLGLFITATYPILTNRGPKSSFFHTQAMPNAMVLFLSVVFMSNCRSKQIVGGESNEEAFDNFV